MGFNPFSSLGSLADSVGTKLHLPELGISELLNGGKATQNTGSKNVLGTNVTPYSYPQSQSPASKYTAPQQQTFSNTPAIPSGAVGGQSFDPNSFENALGSLPAFGADIAGTGAASAAVAPQLQYLPNGQSYDVSTPQGRQSYAAANAQLLGSQRDSSIKNIQDQLRNALASAGTQYNQAGQTIQQNGQNYARDLTNNLFNLGENYNLGQVNNAQKFAGLSPNAFQSSQGTSQQYGTDQYNRGINDLGTQADQTVGHNYLTTGEFDPNSAYGQQQGNLRSSYDNYVRDSQNQAGQGITAANSAYGQGINGQAANFGSADAASGFNPFSYQTQSYDQFTPSNIDISQYTPYSNSSQIPGLQSQPSQPANAGNPLYKALGFTPSAGQTNYLNAFTSR